MALLAGCIHVSAGERVERLRVVEVVLIDLRALPVNGRMALRTRRSEAALVLVCMAGNATRRQPKPCVIQILRRQQATRGWSDVLCAMAGAAAHAGVFSIKQVSRLRVIEPFWRWVPMQQREVLSVMVGVALDAS